MTATSAVRLNSLAHVPERMEDMSSYAEGQTHQLLNSLEAAGFTPADLTALGQNPGLLANIRNVLMGLATIVRACFKLACTKAFNPTEFIGKGWSVWKGPKDGNGLQGEEDRDIREDALSVIDWEQVLLETNLQEGEACVNGEEKLLRLKAGKNVRLGGRAFLSLWEDWKSNKSDSVLEKLRRSKNITRIYFFGTVLRGPGGRRSVLCLYFDGSEWGWDCGWLGSGWSSGGPSASLASVEN